MTTPKTGARETRYRWLKDLLAAFFVMLKILRLLFVELFNNNGRLAPVKTKTTTEAGEA